MNFIKTIKISLCVGLFCLTMNLVAQDIKWSWNNLGEFYLYSKFATGSSKFKGGGDVDTYGNLIYVNRYEGNLDVYKVSIPSGANENQHPDNPAAPGPVATRTLEYVKTYTVSQLAISCDGELYATEKGVYFLKKDEVIKTVCYYEFATGNTSTICDGTNWVKLNLLGYDDINDVWYAGTAYNFEVKRTVYSYSPMAKSWIKEFSYEDLGGGHFDGLEVIATKDGTKIYLSDMTSDYIGIVTKKSGSWEMVTLNKYKDENAGVVEGMGYGAFHHFWITSGSVLYEIGGGGLSVVVPPETVTVSIPVEQMFSVEEQSPQGTEVGDITIVSSNVSKAELKIINDIPEFEVNPQNPFTITVANGANLDFAKQNSYQLLVVVYAKAGVTTTPDTSVVTINIIKKTGVVDGLNTDALNTSINFSIKGKKLVVNDLLNRTYRLGITNAKGQDIMLLPNAINNIIDLSYISHGVYFVSLRWKNREVFSKIYIDK